MDDKEKRHKKMTRYGKINLIGMLSLPIMTMVAIMLCAQMDLDDVDEADALLLLDWQQSSGKMVEFGYALAKGKELFWWHTEKKPPRIYNALPQIHNIYSMEELFLELSKCQL